MNTSFSDVAGESAVSMSTGSKSSPSLPPSVEVVPTIRFSPSQPFRLCCMRPRFLDDVEKIAPFTSAGGKHVVVFDVMVGGPKLRLEFGEGCLAIAKKGGMFRLLGPNPGPELTDEGWVDFVGRTSAELDQRDRKTRQTADLQGDYWRKRHALAQEKLTPATTSGQSIDQLIDKRIDQARRDSGNPDSFFNAKVRPILSEHCFRCHGEKEKGDLNMLDLENLLAGGESGLPAIVPANPRKVICLPLFRPETSMSGCLRRGMGSMIINWQF